MATPEPAIPTIPLTYGLLAGGTLPVYSCCGDWWCFQGAQARYHLWRTHSTPLEEATARVAAVRGAALSTSAPPAMTPRRGKIRTERRQEVDQAPGGTI
jgi:hypothetical protein